jgi:hypothetical protein
LKTGGIRLRFWGGLLIMTVACVLAVVPSAAGETEMYEQTVYDESMDVGGGKWIEAQTHTEVDIVWVRVYELFDDINVEMKLVGDASPEAIYEVRFTIDRTYKAVLECRNGTNLTGFDDRISKWHVTGEMVDDLVVWHVSKETVNATTSLIVDRGMAEISLDKPTRYFDECVWDLTDRLKGQVYVYVSYRFQKDGVVSKWVILNYKDEAAASIRFEMDTDGDRFITQAEVDQYVDDYEMMVNGTDMSMNFKQHTSRWVSISTTVTPGPLNLAREVRFDYHLNLRYPKPPADEMNVRWELELHSGGIPYTRATDNSNFTIDPPTSGDRYKYRFSQWDLSELDERFYEDDYMKFRMNGTEMRTYWVSYMMEKEGFTIFRDDEGRPVDQWTCRTAFGVMMVPLVFVAFTVPRTLGRRRGV